MSLSSAEAEFFALTTGIAEGMVTNHLLQELGHDAILMNHVDSQSAKAWASKRGLRRMNHVMLKCMLVQDGIETRLKQNREVTEQRESEMKRKSVRRSQSAEMKEQCGHEVEKRRVRSRQSVQTSRVSAENNTSFWSSIQHELSSRCRSSDFTFGDNSDEFTISRFFLNLADRDLT